MDLVSVSSIHSNQASPVKRHPRVYKHVGTDIYPVPDFNVKSTYEKVRTKKFS